jgi:hypothetical protein
MLFRRGNRKKSTHRTPLIWRPQAPDQGSTVCLWYVNPLEQVLAGTFPNLTVLKV